MGRISGYLKRKQPKTCVWGFGCRGRKEFCKDLKKVHLNGKPAFVHDASAAPRTFGDQPGVRKGVISRTVGAKAWSKQHSSSVRIHKHKIVRTGDFFHMNGKFSKRLNQNVCLSCKQAVARMKPPIPT